MNLSRYWIIILFCFSLLFKICYLSLLGFLKPYNNQKKPSQNSHSVASSTAAIIGGVHAAGVVVLIVIAVMIVRRKRQKKLKGNRYVSAVLYSPETSTVSQFCYVFKVLNGLTTLYLSELLKKLNFPKCNVKVYLDIECFHPVGWD